MFAPADADGIDVIHAFPSSCNRFCKKQKSSFEKHILSPKMRKVKGRKCEFSVMWRLSLSAKELISSDALIFLRRNGGEAMKYECLKLEERRIIEEMYAKGAKPGEIAERVGQVPSDHIPRARARQDRGNGLPLSSRV